MINIIQGAVYRKNGIPKNADANQKEDQEKLLCFDQMTKILPRTKQT